MCLKKGEQGCILRCILRCFPQLPRVCWLVHGSPLALAGGRPERNGAGAFPSLRPGRSQGFQQPALATARVSQEHLKRAQIQAKLKMLEQQVCQQTNMCGRLKPGSCAQPATERPPPAVPRWRHGACRGIAAGTSAPPSEPSELPSPCPWNWTKPKTWAPLALSAPSAPSALRAGVAAAGTCHPVAGRRPTTPRRSRGNFQVSHVSQTGDGPSMPLLNLLLLRRNRRPKALEELRQEVWLKDLDGQPCQA